MTPEDKAKHETYLEDEILKMGPGHIHAGVAAEQLIAFRLSSLNASIDSAARGQTRQQWAMIAFTAAIAFATVAYVLSTLDQISVQRQANDIQRQMLEL